ncbi:MAG: hypothetical protein QOF51_1111 [Chloroflexota bacterium]|jgi:hypothetical protein|nr:hypothetical protein [Chloroflexota bacterium]
MTETLGSLLVLLMLGVFAARTMPPIRSAIDGRLLLEAHPGAVHRLLDQRVNIISVMAVLALGSGIVGERWVPHELFIVAIAFMIGLLFVPQRYQFTSAGVSPNRASFQPWSAFSSWSTRGDVIWLQRPGRFGALRLYLSGEEREAALKIVRRHVRAGR